MSTPIKEKCILFLGLTGFFLLPSLFAWWPPLLFLVRHFGIFADTKIMKDLKYK
jgi:hypothetical protein